MYTEKKEYSTFVDLNLYRMKRQQQQPNCYSDSQNAEGSAGGNHARAQRLYGAVQGLSFLHRPTCTDQKRPVVIQTKKNETFPFLLIITGASV